MLNVARRLGLSHSPNRYALLGRKRLVRNDPVKVLQEALSATASTSLSSMNAALEAIIEGSLWQLDKPFKSFGDFAVALPPGGLGVRSQFLAPAAPRAPHCRLFSPVDRSSRAHRPSAWTASQKAS